jgi:hypothetical protein
MTYKGYTLKIHPTWTLFGDKICFISRGLTIDKTTGATDEIAIAVAKAKIDYWLRDAS